MESPFSNFAGGGSGTNVPTAFLPSSGTSGAPTAGTWVTGNEAVDSTNRVWVCTAGGTPGTWQLVSTGGGGGGIGPDEGTWATTTVYAVAQVVKELGARYECATAHTSGTFATDLAAGKWVLLGIDPSSATTLPADAAGWLHDDGTGAFVWSTPTASQVAAVAKAGDTMTGLLTLSGAPTATLHAATKTYVDTAVAAGGGSVGPNWNLIAPTGTIVESFSRNQENASGVALSTGQAHAVAIPLVAGQVVTNATFVTGSQGIATGTHQWVALLDHTGTVVAVTADGTSGAWAATSLKTFTFGSPYTVPTSGLYYVVIMVVAGTMPTLVMATVNSTLTGLTPMTNATYGSGLTTPPSLASSASTMTASGTVPWFFLS